MRTNTKTLIAAMRILADDIQSQDGVANAAIYEAADRLGEMADLLLESRILLSAQKDALGMTGIFKGGNALFIDSVLSRIDECIKDKQ